MFSRGSPSTSQQTVGKKSAINFDPSSRTKKFKQMQVFSTGGLLLLPHLKVLNANSASGIMCATTSARRHPKLDRKEKPLWKTKACVERAANCCRRLGSTSAELQPETRNLLRLPLAALLRLRPFLSLGSRGNRGIRGTRRCAPGGAKPRRSGAGGSARLQAKARGDKKP